MFAFNVLEQPVFKRTSLLQEGNKGLRKIPLDMIYFASYQNLLLASFADFLEPKKENFSRIDELIAKNNIDIDIIKLNHSNYKDIVKKQKSEQTFSNLCSLLKCFQIAKEQSEDLVFFVEDDYLHFEPMMEEMIASYERISSQLKKELFVCPTDYPYLYMNNEKTNILIGNKRHWRTVDRTLCTFMTSKIMIDQYWSNFYNNCLDRHDPFEKYLNEIYKKEFCISPLKSLSVHMTNINSSYGLSPFIDYKKIWDENSI